MKFNNALETDWQKFYNSSLTFTVALSQVIELTNSNLIYGGNGGIGCTGFHGELDFLLMETNNIGDTLWNKCYGSSGDESFKSFIVTKDNGYLLVGESFSSDGDIPIHYGDEMSSDAVIIKVDSLGNIEWIKVLGGTSIDASLGNPIETESGNYLIHLYTASSDYDLEDCGIEDIQKRWVLLLDSMGNIVTQEFYSAEDDFFHSDGDIFILKDQILVVGSSNAESALFPAPLGHAGEEGAVGFFNNELQLTKIENWGGSRDDRLYRHQKDDQNNFYFLGVSSSSDHDLPGNYNNGDDKDYWLIKTDSQFNLMWSKDFGGSEFGGDLGGGLFEGSLPFRGSGLIVTETDLTGITFTTTNILKITGQAPTGSTGDITAKFATGFWYPTSNN